MRLPGMLVAKVLRCPYAHAEVADIDTSRAEALAGVAAVLTHRDIREWNGFDRGMKDKPLVAGGYRIPPEEGVVNQRARHYGDAIAAVAAVSEQIAEEALELIDVTYRELPICRRHGRRHQGLRSGDQSGSSQKTLPST